MECRNLVLLSQCKKNIWFYVLIINCLWKAINENLGNALQFVIYSCLLLHFYLYWSFLHPSLFLSLSLPLFFFFIADFIKIGLLFLFFILIDWFYRWRKSLVFKPVNPSITEISWLIWGIWTIMQSNKMLQVQWRTIPVILTPVYIDRIKWFSLCE